MWETSFPILQTLEDQSSKSPPTVMADQVWDEQNIRIVDVNNNLADKNGIPDNAGNPGHSTLPGEPFSGPQSTATELLPHPPQSLRRSKKTMRLPQTI